MGIRGTSRTSRLGELKEGMHSFVENQNHPPMLEEKGSSGQVWSWKSETQDCHLATVRVNSGF